MARRGPSLLFFVLIVCFFYGMSVFSPSLRFGFFLLESGWSSCSHRAVSPTTLLKLFAFSFARQIFNLPGRRGWLLFALVDQVSYPVAFFSPACSPVAPVFGQMLGRCRKTGPFCRSVFELLPYRVSVLPSLIPFSCIYSCITRFFSPLHFAFFRVKGDKKIPPLRSLWWGYW